MSELVKRLRVLQEFWNRRDALTRYMAVEMAVETVVVSAKSADALEAQAKRITELESSLADSNEALQVMGLKLVHAEAENARLQKGLDAVASLIDESAGVAGLHLNGDIATWDSLRTGGSYEEWLMDFDAALNNQSHSANTVVGPAPVMDAAPACERKEELTDILRILDAAPNLPLDSCTPEELQEWTTAIKSVLVHIGASLTAGESDR